MMDTDVETKDLINSVAVDVSEDPNLHETDCRFSYLITGKENWVSFEELENTFYANEIPPCKSKKSKKKDNGFKGYSEKEFKERLAKIKRNATPELKEKIRQKMEAPHIVWYIEESWKTYEEHKAAQKKMCNCPRAKIYDKGLQQIMEVNELADLETGKPSGEVQLVATDFSSSEVPSGETVKPCGKIQAVETEVDASSADVLTAGETVKSPEDTQSDETVTDIEVSPDGTLMSSAEFGSGEIVNPSIKIQIVENEMDTSSVDVLSGETDNLSGGIQSDEANADVSTEVLFETTNSSQNPESFDTEKSNEDVQFVVEAIKSTDDDDHASFEVVQQFQVVLSTEDVESVEDVQLSFDAVKKSGANTPPLPLTSDISVVSTPGPSPWTGESKRKLTALEHEMAARFGLDVSESDTDEDAG